MRTMKNLVKGDRNCLMLIEVGLTAMTVVVVVARGGGGVKGDRSFSSHKIGARTIFMCLSSDRSSDTRSRLLSNVALLPETSHSHHLYQNRFMACGWRQRVVRKL